MQYPNQQQLGGDSTLFLPTLIRKEGAKKSAKMGETNQKNQSPALGPGSAEESLKEIN
jgi:hypothetical protein